MADTPKETPVITADKMMQELNLDETPENNAVVDALIQDASAIVTDSFTSNLSASAKADPIYIRAVKALATALYYDRSLSKGLPLGVSIMIDHLKGRYAKWPQDDSKNGKDSPTSPTSSTTV